MNEIIKNEKKIKKSSLLEKFIDISLLIFLCVKTGIGNSQALEYITFVMFVGSMMLKILFLGKVKISKYVLWYFLFSAYATTSYLWALDKSSVLKTIPIVIALLLFCIAIYNYINEDNKIEKIIKYFIVANLFTSVRIILLFGASTGSIVDKINNITGIYFNTVAQVMGFSIILLFYMYKIHNNKLLLLAIIPQFYVVLLTESRKGLIIPLIGIVIMLFLEKKTIKKLLKYIIVIMICIVILFNFFKINSEFSEKMKQLYTSIIIGQTDDWSITLRNFFIEVGIEIFKDNPIKGIGLNNFAYYVGNHTGYTEERYSHNNYIEIISCLGIIGLLLYYSMHIYLMVKLIKKFMINKDTNIILAMTLMIIVLIFDWGIVSYSGCMYNIVILIAYKLSNKDNIVIMEENDDKKILEK